MPETTDFFRHGRSAEPLSVPRFIGGHHFRLGAESRIRIELQQVLAESPQTGARFVSAPHEPGDVIYGMRTNNEGESARDRCFGHLQCVADGISFLEHRLKKYVTLNKINPFKL